MIRAIALLIFAGLVAALFLVPGASPSRLSTSQAGDLLLVEGPILDPEGAPVLDADGTPLVAPLWKLVLESPAVTVETAEDGTSRRVLLLGGAFFRTGIIRDGETFDFMWHRHVGKSLIRKLRSVVAAKNLDIEIPAFKKPLEGGVSFEFQIAEEGTYLQANIGGDPIGERETPRRKVSQLSLLPPLVAIFLAILFRRPVLALFFGVLAGAFLVRSIGGGGAFVSAGGGLLDVFTVYLKGELVNRARTQIILFVVFMLAMVGVITRAGGIRGVMNKIAALAKDARQTQVATWLMGLAIFFDDYANTILVGATMRPLADRFKVAREKLAYIVDSTAAPVAGVSILSTWIAFEVSTFSAQLPDAGLAPSDGYAIFIQTLPFRFYCWFTLIFVGVNVFMGRDFGPMLKAERRARSGQVLREGATPLVGKSATELEASEHVEVRASTALIPLALFILTVLGKITWDGMWGSGLLVESDGFLSLAYVAPTSGGPLATVTGILYAGSGNEPLMIGAIVGFISASFFAVIRGLGIKEILAAALNSLRAMYVAVVILYLAWMVGKACSDLGTATYLSATISEAIPYMLLPLILFGLAGVIAFSTGSSWSTMTILLPLVVGLSYDIGYSGADVGVDANQFALTLMIISIGAVLEGAIFGDHCSPISDTTIMSSIACASDHIDHVRTQAPYAIMTMIVALAVGYFPVTFFGMSPWMALLIGAAVLIALLRYLGERVEAPAGSDTHADGAR